MDCHPVPLANIYLTLLLGNEEPGCGYPRHCSGRILRAAFIIVRLLPLFDLVQSPLSWGAGVNVGYISAFRQAFQYPDQSFHSSFGWYYGQKNARRLFPRPQIQRVCRGTPSKIT